MSETWHNEKPRFNKEIDTSGQQMRVAMINTLDLLMMDRVGHTEAVGKRSLGEQVYVTGGWFKDDESNGFVQITAEWREQTLLGSFLLNKLLGTNQPPAKRRTLGSVSVVQTTPLMDEHGFFVPDRDQVRLAFWGDYWGMYHDVSESPVEVAECEAESGYYHGFDNTNIYLFGSGMANLHDWIGDEWMYGQYSEYHIGSTPPETEQLLIDSLQRGNEIGWNTYGGVS